MELIKWEPFAGFGKIPSLFNELFESNFGNSRAQPSASRWYPAVDVLESKDAYLLRAELPGMKKEDIKVEVTDGTLVVSGERKSEQTAEGVEYRHVERFDAKFYRSFSLPETVKQDSIAATYNDGVLEIRVPKAEEAKPRQIEVAVH
jgi:HSP20 family protein